VLSSKTQVKKKRDVLIITRLFGGGLGLVGGKRLETVVGKSTKEDLISGGESALT